jgi:tetratricopeptide (TPR) repeat protein
MMPATSTEPRQFGSDEGAALAGQAFSLANRAQRGSFASSAGDLVAGFSAVRPPRLRQSGPSLMILLSLALPLCSPAQTTEQGISAFQHGRYAEAASLLEKAAVRNPSDEHVQVFLALARAATGHCADAVPQLTARWNHSANPDLARLSGLALVQCFVAAGQTAKALPVSAQLEASYPDDADVIYQAARLHMRAFNDLTQRMFDKTPASYRVNQLSAEIFETQNRFSEAAAEYRKAIAKNPQALNLHFRLGRAILLESHDPQALAQARKEFEAELALNPSDAATEFQVGQILNAGNQAAEAVPHFEKALFLSPDFAEAALAIGRIRVEAKEYADAIPLLERVIALQPANEAAHYNLMLAYRNSHQIDKARREQQQLDKLKQSPEGEFTYFLKKLGEKTPDKPDK